MERWPKSDGLTRIQIHVEPFLGPSLVNQFAYWEHIRTLMRDGLIQEDSDGELIHTYSVEPWDHNED